MAAVEGGEDPGLVLRTLCQLSFPFYLVAKFMLFLLGGPPSVCGIGGRVPLSGGNRCPLLAHSGHCTRIGCQFASGRHVVSP